LKDVTKAYGDLKINILYLNSITDKRGALAAVVIKTGFLTRSQIEQVLVKLKKIPGVKEINYKLIR
jgi:(p)ppGpp synthase/HD superfamily hydrolase